MGFIPIFLEHSFANSALLVECFTEIRSMRGLTHDLGLGRGSREITVGSSGDVLPWSGNVPKSVFM